MNLTTDQTFTWQGFGNGFGKWHSQCRLRIFQAETQTIVLVSDQGLETGTSITNCAAELANLVVTTFHLDPKTLTWIEHYPTAEAEFSLVAFDWFDAIADNPRWQYLPTEAAIAFDILGESRCCFGHDRFTGNFLSYGSNTQWQSCFSPNSRPYRPLCLLRL